FKDIDFNSPDLDQIFKNSGLFKPDPIKNMAYDFPAAFVSHGLGEGFAEVVVTGLLQGNWAFKWETFVFSGTSAMADMGAGMALGSGAGWLHGKVFPNGNIFTDFINKSYAIADLPDGAGSDSPADSDSDSDSDSGSDPGSDYGSDSRSGAGPDLPKSSLPITTSADIPTHGDNSSSYRDNYSMYEGISSLYEDNSSLYGDNSSFTPGYRDSDTYSVDSYGSSNSSVGSVFDDTASINSASSSDSVGSDIPEYNSSSALTGG
ncbi:hypothetical protein AB4Z54_44810, partial [Streptomyces sp. MCAF7]